MVSHRLEDLVSCWQVKAVASVAVSVFTFLIGEPEAAFLALWVLVILDTITKWAAVAKRTLEKQQAAESIWYGLYLAWHSGTLNSRDMRRKFSTKVFAYMMLIIAGHLVAVILPSINVMGNDLSRFPGNLVYSFLAVTELMSIIENLIAMGMDVLKPLALWASKKRDEITGGKSQ
jgi:phage-related holin